MVLDDGGCVSFMMASLLVGGGGGGGGDGTGGCGGGCGCSGDGDGDMRFEWFGDGLRIIFGDLATFWW